MDYAGQYLAEVLYSWIIIGMGCIGWLHGYIVESFLITYYWWLIATVVCIPLCCWDWKFYNKEPIAWLSDIPRSSEPYILLEDRDKDTSSTSQESRISGVSKNNFPKISKHKASKKNN